MFKLKLNGRSFHKINDIKLYKIKSIGCLNFIKTSIIRRHISCSYHIES